MNGGFAGENLRRIANEAAVDGAIQHHLTPFRGPRNEALRAPRPLTVVPVRARSNEMLENLSKRARAWFCQTRFRQIRDLLSIFCP
jgi:hypothetical protein